MLSYLILTVIYFHQVTQNQSPRSFRPGLDQAMNDGSALLEVSRPYLCTRYTPEPCNRMRTR